MKTYQVRIEKEILEKARKYCKKKGLKLTWLVSRAIEKDLENKEKVNAT